MSDLQTRAPAPTPEPDRPIALTPDFSGMPADLLPLQIWVVWRYEWDGKKTWRKVPYIPVVYDPSRRRKAKTNDPTTWRSYADAKKVYLACPDIFDGVGVVLDGDLIGGDFDHCYDAATDLASDFARDYLPNTYAEYSVSGLFPGATMPASTRGTPSSVSMMPMAPLTPRRLAWQPAAPSVGWALRFPNMPL